MAETQDSKVWLQERLAQLYKCPSEEFGKAFESTFAQELALSVNGEAMTREQLRETIEGINHASKGNVSTEFHRVDEVGTGAGAQAHEAGAEGEETRTFEGSWTVTRTLPFRVRAAPMQRRRVIEFKATVRDVGDAGEGRRVVALTETVDDTAPPVHVHPIPGAAESATEGGQGK